MSDLFYSLDVKVEVDKLQKDLEYVLSLTSWHPLNSQICVQYRAGDILGCLVGILNLNQLVLGFATAFLVFHAAFGTSVVM